MLSQHLLRSRISIPFKRFQHTIKQHDVIIARSLSKPDEKFYLSQPLEPGKVINTGNGYIPHEMIIGKPCRTLVEPLPMAKKKNELRDAVSPKPAKYILCRPTMEEYVINRKREAQPIYPLDAGLIVQLADITVDLPEMCEDQQNGDAVNWNKYLQEGLKQTDRECSEVWRGKSLDMEDPYDKYVNARQEKFKKMNVGGKKIITKEAPQQFLECGTGHGSLTLNIVRAIHSGNAYYDGEDDRSRGAILHSLDKKLKHLKVGMGNLKHFARGMYWPDVEFHLCENGLSEWLDGECASYYREVVGRGSPNGFLSGVFLDLPSPELHLSKLAQDLGVDCPIIVFVPSVMQIWDCLSKVKNEGIKLTLTKTYELMPGSGGGGMREWNLRKAIIRETGLEGMVVRPKVGVRVVGGGFIGVFKKLPNSSVVKEWKE